MIAQLHIIAYWHPLDSERPGHGTNMFHKNILESDTLDFQELRGLPGTNTKLFDYVGIDMRNPYTKYPRTKLSCSNFSSLFGD